MKVLHVHQIAYIPEFLVDRLRRKGVDAEFAEDVNASMIKDYDIVHGHYALNRRTIKAFRLARRFNVPFILHCHGSDVRLLTGTGRKPLPFHYRTISQFMRKRACKVFLSTPDLKEFSPGSEYIPNPVNLEMFKPMPEIEKSARDLICGKQVKGSRLLDFIKKDREYDCVNTGAPFDFPKNVHQVPYVGRQKFPGFLNRYRTMIGTVGDVISMARLEAMACGLKTFTDFEPSFARFYEGQNPDNVEDPRDFIKKHHDPDNTVKRLIEVYEAVR